MALAHRLNPSLPSPGCIPSALYNQHEQSRDSVLGFAKGMNSQSMSVYVSRILIGSDSGMRRVNPRRRGLNAASTGTPIVENVQTRNTIEIPVTCYQLIGVPDKAEKDEIVKSVMQLKSAEVEDGYTMEAVMARQSLLMDVRDKLLFEPEYAGNVKEKVPPKSSLRIPWGWLPAALCLLQEVGKEKLVLEIGRLALQYPDAKPYIHDLLLAMALAECAIAKTGFEKNKVSQGFEALARAQCLLRSKISLGKMTLLSQIEESLEELAPACTLELLGMPHSPENVERRRGAISALHELIRQGLDVETLSRVQDWPCFMSQALSSLIASEIVDLLPWDDLAVTRKNKKSMESQNQRGVIDFNCFYVATIAHIALGFSSRQMELIKKARVICECLIAAEGVDLKLEEAFCLLLLGQGTEAEAIERLKHLELTSNSASRKSAPTKEGRDFSEKYVSLESWLKDAVLAVFPDTRDCSPSLIHFFNGKKRSHVTKKSNGTPQAIPTVTHRQISVGLISEQRDFEGSIQHMNSSQHLGSAVKQLAPVDLQSPLISDKNNSGSNVSTQSVQLKRTLGIHHNKDWGGWLSQINTVKRIIIVSILGCVVFATIQILGMNISKTRRVSKWTSSKPIKYTSSLSWTGDSSTDYHTGPARSITCMLKKLLLKAKKDFRNHSGVWNPQGSHHTASLSSSVSALYKRLMPLEEAEALVKQWQVIKAEALGPSHEVHSLSEILDEPMITQWQALAEAAKGNSCYWRFVLLQLSVLRAEIFSDGVGVEMAEIEAVIEEAAELVDESQLKNPNYYSTYKIHYVLKRQDGSWKFCECDIETPSST